MPQRIRKEKMENVPAKDKTAAELVYEENQQRVSAKKRSVKIEKMTIEKICEQEAARLLNENNAKFQFGFINYDIRTVFVQECKDSVERVSHALLSTLKERINKVNKKYTVGIITTRTVTKDDEIIELSDADIQFINDTNNPPPSATIV